MLVTCNCIFILQLSEKLKHYLGHPERLAKLPKRSLTYPTYDNQEAVIAGFGLDFGQTIYDEGTRERARQEEMGILKYVKATITPDKIYGPDHIVVQVEQRHNKDTGICDVS